MSTTLDGMDLRGGTTFTLPPVPAPAPKPPGYRLACLLAMASVRWECNARLYVSEPKEVNQCAE